MMKASKVSICVTKSNRLSYLVLAALAVPGMAIASGVETTEHKEEIHVVSAPAHTFGVNAGLVSNCIFRDIAKADTDELITTIVG